MSVIPFFTVLLYPNLQWAEWEAVTCLLSRYPAIWSHWTDDMSPKRTKKVQLGNKNATGLEVKVYRRSWDESSIAK